MSVRKQYYEALQIAVSTTGNYTFTSISSMDTYGYLFIEQWHPRLLCMNLLHENDDMTKGMLQFHIRADLQTSTTYILLVTTYRSDTTGKFTIHVFGPANISVLRIDDMRSSSGQSLCMLAQRKT